MKLKNVGLHAPVAWCHCSSVLYGMFSSAAHWIVALVCDGSFALWYVVMSWAVFLIQTFCVGYDCVSVTWPCSLSCIIIIIDNNKIYTFLSFHKFRGNNICMKYTLSQKRKPAYFCLQLHQKSRDFNAIFLVRFKNHKNVWQMWRYESNPPHVVLPHCIVKLETPKMHLNTNSPFNVN